MLYLFAALCTLLQSYVSYADQWAVLVSGSTTYGNYRHQADVCHAYQLLKKNGVPEENIIAFFVDDVAQDSHNPYPGQLFNAPTESGVPGTDVYKGCVADYSGADVNPTNFLNVLTGQTEAMRSVGSGKVLKSTKNDTVFINFVDHGAPGFICFPHEYLYASDLNQALQTMHDTGMYKQLVFYLEACESGSMFADSLPTDINIYALTAANEKESSWGTYCPPYDTVEGVDMRTCLGDLYSVNWMEDVDKTGTGESLETQFETVQEETSKSHVMQYGEVDWLDEPISTFMGDRSARVRSAAQDVPVTPSTAAIKQASAVRAHDIPMHLAYYEYLRAHEQSVHSRIELANQLQGHLLSRIQTDVRFISLAKVFAGQEYLQMLEAPAPSPLPWTCYEQAVKAYEQHCGPVDDYATQYMRVLANMCGVAEVQVNTADVGGTVARAVQDVCQEQ